jgi:GT2 family glycosyltransferase
LNWNSYEITRDCILSLQNQVYTAFEIIIVDNGSVDGSIDQLRQEFPQVKIIRNEANRGFTGGNNIGIRDALRRHNDYLLLLNNDTVVAPNFISELITIADGDCLIGIASPKILFFDQPDHLNYAGGYYRPWKVFPKLFGYRELDNGTYDSVREVSFNSGCALLIRSDVIRKTGLLDEIFFHGFEDVDLTYRVLQAGYKAYYVPKAIVWHKESYTARTKTRRGFKEFYLGRNCILCARKHLPLIQWPIFTAVLTAWLTYRTLIYLLNGETVEVKELWRGILKGFTTRNRRTNPVIKIEAAP